MVLLVSQSCSLTVGPLAQPIAHSQQPNTGGIVVVVVVVVLVVVVVVVDVLVVVVVDVLDVVVVVEVVVVVGWVVEVVVVVVRVVEVVVVVVVTHSIRTSVGTGLFEKVSMSTVPRYGCLPATEPHRYGTSALTGCRGRTSVPIGRVGSPPSYEITPFCVRFVCVTSSELAKGAFPDPLMVAVTSMLKGSLTSILALGRAPQLTVALSTASSSEIPTDVKWESVPVIAA